MGRSESALEKIQRFRNEANAELKAMDDQMSAIRARMLELGQRGTVSADEAMESFKTALASQVDQGKVEIRRYLEPFTRSRIQSPDDEVPGLLRWSAPPSLNQLLTDSDNLGAVVAALFEDQLTERMQAIIDERCTGDVLPAADQRKAEIERLRAKLKSLGAERDALQDEIARSFGGSEPTPQTAKAERARQNQAIIDGLNQNHPDPISPEQRYINQVRGPAA
jgi:hypothetical protein